MRAFAAICLLRLQPLSLSSMMPRSQLRGLADHVAAPRGTGCVLPLSIHQTIHRTPPVNVPAPTIEPQPDSL
jgi:hypothetical protein